MIKTRKHYEHEFIDNPSWKRVTASKLEEWKCYLHYNLGWYRKIMSIEWKDVLYKDFTGHPNICTKAHFAHTCQYEATQEEIEFLDKSQYY